MKDIWNNYTPENLAKLKRGYFCTGDDIDYETTNHKAKTKKLFGLQTDILVKKPQLPLGFKQLNSLQQKL